MNPVRKHAKNVRGSAVAGGVGFEPTTTGLGGLRPVRTRLPARMVWAFESRSINVFSFCRILISNSDEEQLFIVRGGLLTT